MIKNIIDKYIFEILIKKLKIKAFNPSWVINSKKVCIDD